MMKIIQIYILNFESKNNFKIKVFINLKHKFAERFLLMEMIEQVF